jgi:hypothetical protein|tara:strand:- start:830 stop:1042 length:213 start_codon:yes stop_codon:yes gene_type:complete
MSTKDDTKTISIKEIESKREELVQNNKALAERIQLLNQEHTNITNQIHMTNGALNVVNMLLDEKSQTNEE